MSGNRNTVDDIMKKYKVDIDKAVANNKYLNARLIASVISKESKGNKNAYNFVNNAPHQGLMQLSPAAISDINAMGVNVTDPFNASQNIAGGSKYLEHLIELYKGDRAKGLAAYNFGQGNIKHNRPLPNETRDYVSSISRMAGNQ